MAGELIFTDGSNMPVGTMFCIGKNYAKHAREMGGSVPKAPVVFLKPPQAYIPDGGKIVIPEISANVHHEVELVIVIGKDCGNVAGENAKDYIAGVAVGIDVTLRDVQSEAKKNGTPWAVAKGFKTSAPISRIVSLDKAGNIDDLELSLYVNGEERQRGFTKDMERSAGDLVEYLSAIFSLRRGDIIFTGTPEGVGPLKSGDSVRAELKGFAKLEVIVA